MRRTTLLAAVLAAAVVAGVASAAITKHATTKSYALTLNIGPVEAMYTPAQVKAKHPKTGEVMLGGAMMSPGMGHGAMRHLELHIRSRATGKVLQIMPTMKLMDLSVMHAMAGSIPVVKMRGIGEGMSDVHYGNNVALVIGHRYALTATVHGEHAGFTFKAA